MALRSVSCLLFLVLFDSGAFAEKHIALLIGNEAFTSEIGQRTNPHNDIALLAQAIKGLGFEVTDAGLDTLTREVDGNTRRIQSARPNAVGFFYYFGQGASEGVAQSLRSADRDGRDAGWDSGDGFRLARSTGSTSSSAPPSKSEAAKQIAVGPYVDPAAMPESREILRPYVERGMAYQHKQDYDGAIEEFTKALRLYPNSIAVLYARAGAYLGKKKYDSAIADYTEAIRLNPKVANSFSLRGSGYLLQGDYNQAITDFTEAIRLNPKDADSFYYRGLGKRSKGDRAGAEADMATARAIDQNVGK